MEIINAILHNWCWFEAHLYRPRPTVVFYAGWNLIICTGRGVLWIAAKTFMGRRLQTVNFVVRARRCDSGSDSRQNVNRCLHGLTCSPYFVRPCKHRLINRGDTRRLLEYKRTKGNVMITCRLFFLYRPLHISTLAYVPLNSVGPTRRR